jgi:lipopolysaccharide/colanic/teichoic acid biosynthesis glycosyltransferase
VTGARRVPCRSLGNAVRRQPCAAPRGHTGNDAVDATVAVTAARVRARNASRGTTAKPACAQAATVPSMQLTECVHPQPGPPSAAYDGSERAAARLSAGAPRPGRPRANRSRADRSRGDNRSAGGLGRGRLIRPAVRPAADSVALAAAAFVTGAGLVRGGAYCAAVLVAFAAAGLYRAGIGQRVSDQAPRVAVAATVPALALAAWSGPGRALLLGGCAAGLVLAARTVASAALRAAHRRGLLVRRTLILGSGSTAATVTRLLRLHPELGLRVSGALDSQPGGAPLPMLGRLEDASAVLARFDIDQVLVCFPAVGQAELTATLRSCREAGVAVSVVPRLRDLGMAVPRTCLDEIWGLPLIPLRPDAAAPGRRVGKRILDLTGGLALLVLTAPLVALLSLAVRADLRLPPFFRQVRVVGRGRRATITKLRTLRPAGDPDTTWAIPAGQCTALGRVLRGSHADELPQLGSVLRGHMSLVGPRPERPHFARRLAREVPGYRDRERVNAGLTGWAQVHGLTGDTSIADRARFDNFYIEYGSVWLDLLILARTVPAALAGALHTVRGGTR